MEIRKLIEKLEKIEKEALSNPHGNPKVDITLSFKDPLLEDRWFITSNIRVTESWRVNCGCVDGADIWVDVE